MNSSVNGFQSGLVQQAGRGGLDLTGQHSRWIISKKVTTRHLLRAADHAEEV